MFLYEDLLVNLYLNIELIFSLKIIIFLKYYFISIPLFIRDFNYL